MQNPPPADRKEALRRMRERRRDERREAREGMQRGDEKYLLPRDLGPERALVRDMVDSRRNVGSFFLIGALIIIIGNAQSMPPAVRLGAELGWYALLLSFALDSVLLCRKIKREVWQRFPKTTQRPRSLYFYALMRSITFRGMRVPRARVKPGNPLPG